MSLHRNNTFLFYVIPLLLPLIFFGAEYGLSSDKIPAFYSEYGPVELFQEAILFISLFMGIYIFRKLKPDQSRWLKIWIGLAIVGCFYVAFEEISWGQTFLKWESPESWAAINKQGETNIHNASQLFNSVPRTILEIGILVGGLIIPALLAWCPSVLPKNFAPIYPKIQIAFLSVIALCMKLLEQYQGMTDVRIFGRKSEVMETFLYYFVFLYLVCLIQKWVKDNRFKP